MYIGKYYTIEKKKDKIKHFINLRQLYQLIVPKKNNNKITVNIKLNIQINRNWKLQHIVCKSVLPIFVFVNTLLLVLPHFFFFMCLISIKRTRSLYNRFILRFFFERLVTLVAIFTFFFLRFNFFFFFLPLMYSTPKTK